MHVQSTIADADDIRHDDAMAAPTGGRTNVASRLIYALRALRRRGSHHLGCRPRQQWTMRGVY
jgi:hypothetical protein